MVLQLEIQVTAQMLDHVERYRVAGLRPRGAAAAGRWAAVALGRAAPPLAGAAAALGRPRAAVAPVGAVPPVPLRLLMRTSFL